MDKQHYTMAFKETDNSGLGLVLKFERPEFYVEGLETDDLLETFQGAAPIQLQLGYEGVDGEDDVDDYIEAEYQTICEQELTIHHEGSSYTVAAGTVVKFAQLGDRERITYIELTGDYIIRAEVLQIYWSQHYPTRLYFSAGRNPDTSQPAEGIYLLAEMQISPDRQLVIVPKAPSIAPKATSFLMLPKMEIHQLSRSPDGFSWAASLPAEGSDILQTQQSFLPIRDMGLTVKPADLENEAMSAPLHFLQRLSDGSIPAAVLWHFLIKMLIHDRLGRLPRNMPQAEDYLEYGIEDFLPDDYEGVNTFWVPDSGYTAIIRPSLDTWLRLRIKLEIIDIGRAVPLWGWEPT